MKQRVDGMDERWAPASPGERLELTRSRPVGSVEIYLAAVGSNDLLGVVEHKRYDGSLRSFNMGMRRAIRCTGFLVWFEPLLKDSHAI
jgi:hypothetical protein